MSGWYYTPGWGALGTVTVAIIALVVSVAFNIATLRRAKAQTLQQRRDALFDKLRDEIASFLTEIEECRMQSRKLGAQIRDIANQFHEASKDVPPRPVLESPLVTDYMLETHKAFIDTVADVHVRLAIRGLRIMFLTTDPEILKPMSKIQKLIDEDRHDFEVLVLARKDKSPADLSNERGQTMLERHESRYSDVFEETETLGLYCAEHFPLKVRLNQQR